MRGALGAPDGVDAAVHHAHPHPVPGGVEGCALAPLVGHGVVAAQHAGFSVGLERQVPASHLKNKARRLTNRPPAALILNTTEAPTV